MSIPMKTSCRAGEWSVEGSLRRGHPGDSVRSLVLPGPSTCRPEMSCASPPPARTTAASSSPDGPQPTRSMTPGIAASGGRRRIRRGERRRDGRRGGRARRTRPISNGLRRSPRTVDTRAARWLVGAGAGALALGGLGAWLVMRSRPRRRGSDGRAPPQYRRPGSGEAGLPPSIDRTSRLVLAREPRAGEVSAAPRRTGNRAARWSPTSRWSDKGSCARRRPRRILVARQRAFLELGRRGRSPRSSCAAQHYCSSVEVPSTKKLTSLCRRCKDVPRCDVTQSRNVSTPHRARRRGTSRGRPIHQSEATGGGVVPAQSARPRNTARRRAWIVEAASPSVERPRCQVVTIARRTSRASPPEVSSFLHAESVAMTELRDDEDRVFAGCPPAARAAHARSAARPAVATVQVHERSHAFVIVVAGRSGVEGNGRR